MRKFIPWHYEEVSVSFNGEDVFLLNSCSFVLDRFRFLPFKNKIVTHSAHSAVVPPPFFSKYASKWTVPDALF